MGGTIRELEEVGGEGVGENSAECLRDLGFADNDWEIKRDDARVEAKSPLVNNDEWEGGNTKLRPDEVTPAEGIVRGVKQICSGRI